MFQMVISKHAFEMMVICLKTYKLRRSRGCFSHLVAWLGRCSPSVESSVLYLPEFILIHQNQGQTKCSTGDKDVPIAMAHTEEIQEYEYCSNDAKYDE